MKKINSVLFFLSLLLFASSLCFGQEWAVTYGKGNTDDEAHSIGQTRDGGYVVAGHTYGSRTRSYWVLRLDDKGDVVWQKKYRRAEYDSANSIEQTADGGYVVAGYSYSFDIESADFWVLKLDADGDIVWQKTYDGSNTETARSIQQTTDGGYVVAGGSGSSDIWVLKLDADGDIVWQKTYGGSNGDGARSIQQTTDGGYVVAGWTESFGAGDRDFWVLKLDGNGDVIWQKTYGGNDYDYGYSIRQTTDGGYIVAGVTSSFGVGPGYDSWVLKLDGNGDITWQKTYGGNDYEIGYSIRQTTDGGYILAGGTLSFGAGWSDSWVLKLDGNGDIVWQKTYGGSRFDFARSIRQTADGGYIFAGETQSFGASGFGNLAGDIWVLKLDANGEIPGCSLIGDSNTIGIDTSSAETDTDVTPQDSTVTPADTTASPKSFYPGRTVPCGAGPALNIGYTDPLDGPYGTKITLKGGQFGNDRTGMFDQQEGYCSFVTFSGTQTLIGTQYPVWSDDKVKVKFKKLFVDEDGDFLQDGNEPTLTVEQIVLEDYILKVNTVRFDDLNTNGIYDDGDSILAADSSNPMLFALTDEPVVYALIPNSTPASEPGIPAKVRIRGLNFGEPQGASILHIGGRSWPEGHTKIKIWEDYRIKFKVPEYDPPFPRFKDVWVTVNGKDSNKVQLKITAP